MGGGEKEKKGEGENGKERERKKSRFEKRVTEHRVVQSCEIKVVKFIKTYSFRNRKNFRTSKIPIEFFVPQKIVEHFSNC